MPPIDNTLLPRFYVSNICLRSHNLREGATAWRPAARAIVPT